MQATFFRSPLSAVRIARVITLLGLSFLLNGLTGCVDSDLLCDRAEGRLQANQLVEAEVNLNLAEERMPSYWRTQMLLGELRIRQSRALDAQIALQRAWSLRPLHPETEMILDKLAEAYFIQGQDAFPALRDFLNETIRQYGKPYDYVRQGVYLQKMEDPDAALIALRKARAIGGLTEVRTHTALAAFYGKLGDRRLEIESLRHALFLKPEDVNIQNRLSELGVVPGPAATLAPPLNQ